MARERGLARMGMGMEMDVDGMEVRWELAGAMKWRVASAVRHWRIGQWMGNRMDGEVEWTAGWGIGECEWERKWEGAGLD